MRHLSDETRQTHHLYCITSSNDSEKLEKSLCVRDKAEDLCWMPVVFLPSDNTASLMILSLKLHMCIRYRQLACFGRH